MTPKELLYVKDALGHEQHMQQKCQQTASQLTDKSLQNYVKKLETRFGDHFTTLYDTVDKS